MVGMSGLTKHPESGTYYAVGERERLLFPITVQSGGQPVAGAPIPIENVPDGVDLESVAFVDSNTMVFGTESKDEARTEDAILYAAFTPTKVTVLDERTRAYFSYEAYGIRPDPNRGVEALCTFNASMVAISEQVIERDGLRLAAVQIYDPLTRGWTPYEVPLTSTEGKIAGIACAGNAAAINVVAIERHYATMRLINFSVPIRGTSMQRLSSELAVDLAESLGPKPKNFEGIEVSSKGGVFIISDNSHGSLDGPTTMLHITKIAREHLLRYGGGIH